MESIRKRLGHWLTALTGSYPLRWHRSPVEEVELTCCSDSDFCQPCQSGNLDLDVGHVSAGVPKPFRAIESLRADTRRMHGFGCFAKTRPFLAMATSFHLSDIRPLPVKVR